jgi:hypothetical protein
MEEETLIATEIGAAEEGAEAVLLIAATMTGPGHDHGLRRRRGGGLMIGSNERGLRRETDRVSAEGVEVRAEVALEALVEVVEEAVEGVAVVGDSGK